MKEMTIILFHNWFNFQFFFWEY